MKQLIWLMITVILCLVLYMAPADYRQDTLVLLLAACSILPFGMALKSGNRKALIMEGLIFVLLFSLALGALYVHILLGAGGFFLLALWSYLHRFIPLGPSLDAENATGLTISSVIFSLFIVMAIYLQTL